MDKFKVGDRVRSKQPSYSYTGTIIEIGSKLAIIKRDDGKSDDWSCKIKRDKIATANGCWDDKHYLELSSSPAPAELRVGNRVKIKKSSKYFASQGNHGIGTIEGEDFGADWKVVFPDKYKNSYNNHDLEEVRKTTNPLGTVTSSDLRLYKD